MATQVIPLNAPKPFERASPISPLVRVAFTSPITLNKHGEYGRACNGCESPIINMALPSGSISTPSYIPPMDLESGGNIMNCS